MISEVKDSDFFMCLTFLVYTQMRTPANMARKNAPAVTTPATAPGPCLQSWLWQDDGLPLVFTTGLWEIESESAGDIAGGGDLAELAVGIIKLVAGGGGGGGEDNEREGEIEGNDELKLHHSIL